MDLLEGRIRAVHRDVDTVRRMVPDGCNGGNPCGLGADW